VYQIKFKGNLSSSLKILAKRFRVTIETSDVAHPVTMLTGELSGQTELLEVLDALHKQGHSIISMACIEVISDDNHQAAV
jgi:hypothetical protein